MSGMKTKPGESYPLNRLAEKNLDAFTLELLDGILYGLYTARLVEPQP